MSIPASVEAILNKHQIAYGLTETPAFGDTIFPITQYLSCAGATRSVVLQDAKGKVQVIIPADSMLDLALLTQLTSRDLRALADAELRDNFCRKSAILTASPTTNYRPSHRCG